MTTITICSTNHKTTFIHHIIICRSLNTITTAKYLITRTKTDLFRQFQVIITLTRFRTDLKCRICHNSMDIKTIHHLTIIYESLSTMDTLQTHRGFSRQRIMHQHLSNPNRNRVLRRNCLQIIPPTSIWSNSLKRNSVKRIKTKTGKN